VEVGEEVRREVYMRKRKGEVMVIEVLDNCMIMSMSWERRLG
jgi:hypothetical protein